MTIRSNHSSWWLDHPPAPHSLRAVEWDHWFTRRCSGGEMPMWRHYAKPGAQFVYFIEFGQIVKVGLSKYPWHRFSVVVGELRRFGGYRHIVEAAGPGAPIDLRHVAYGGHSLETAIHRYLMRDHVSGEWFRLGRRVRRVKQHLSAQGLLFDVDKVYPLEMETR